MLYKDEYYHRRLESTLVSQLGEKRARWTALRMLNGARLASLRKSKKWMGGHNRERERERE